MLAPHEPPLHAGLARFLVLQRRVYGGCQTNHTCDAVVDVRKLPGGLVSR